jgi:hypothetical protein
MYGERISLYSAPAAPKSRRSGKQGTGARGRAGTFKSPRPPCPVQWQQAVAVAQHVQQTLAVGLPTTAAVNLDGLLSVRYQSACCGGL